MESTLQTKEKIKEFILTSSYIDDDQINNETLIFAQGIMDSMGFMSLISFLEETFSINANDDELLESNFESIDAIAAFIEKKLNQNLIAV